MAKAIKIIPVSFDLSPTEQAKATSAVIWSYDQQTVLVRVTVFNANQPFNLQNVDKARIKMFMGNNEGDAPSQYIDVTKMYRSDGILEFYLPDNILGFVGNVYCHLYFDYFEDELNQLNLEPRESSDVGNFTFIMKRSIIDEDVPKLAVYYYERLDTVINRIEKEINEKLSPLLESNDFTDLVNHQIRTTLDDTISRILKNADDFTSYLNNLRQQANNLHDHYNTVLGDVDQYFIDLQSRWDSKLAELTSQQDDQIENFEERFANMLNDFESDLSNEFTEIVDDLKLQYMGFEEELNSHIETFKTDWNQQFADLYARLTTSNAEKWDELLTELNQWDASVQTFITTGESAIADYHERIQALEDRIAEINFDIGTNDYINRNELDTAIALAVSPKADTATVNASLATKANNDDVTTWLDAKADTTTVNASLATKVDQTTHTEALATKADQSTVTNLAGNLDALTTQVGTKADQTTVGGLGDELNNVKTILNNKASVEDVDQLVGGKANQADVTNALALKADKSTVANDLADQSGRLTALQTDVVELQSNLGSATKLKDYEVTTNRVIDLTADRGQLYKAGTFSSFTLSNVTGSPISTKGVNGFNPDSSTTLTQTTTSSNYGAYLSIKFDVKKANGVHGTTNAERRAHFLKIYGDQFNLNLTVSGSANGADYGIQAYVNTLDLIRLDTTVSTTPEPVSLSLTVDDITNDGTFWVILRTGQNATSGSPGARLELSGATMDLLTDEVASYLDIPRDRVVSEFMATQEATNVSVSSSLTAKADRDRIIWTGTEAQYNNLSTTTKSQYLMFAII